MDFFFKYYYLETEGVSFNKIKIEFEKLFGLCN